MSLHNVYKNDTLNGMKKQRTPKHVPTNFRLSVTARALLDALMIKLGVSSRTAVMERAIRLLAAQENVTENAGKPAGATASQ
jgi:SAM-dependent MidA family methyltransferase